LGLGQRCKPSSVCYSQDNKRGIKPFLVQLFHGLPFLALRYTNLSTARSTASVKCFRCEVNSWYCASKFWRSHTSVTQACSSCGSMRGELRQVYCCPSKLGAADQRSVGGIGPSQQMVEVRPTALHRCLGCRLCREHHYRRHVPSWEAREGEPVINQLMVRGQALRLKPVPGVCCLMTFRPGG
jgi:hypothetical protein